MPGMTYEETENETMMEALLSFFFQAASEEKQTAAYETQVESTLSYEDDSCQGSGGRKLCG